MSDGYVCNIPKLLPDSFARKYFKVATMKLACYISFLLVCVEFIRAEQQWPLHNDGINSLVEWYEFLRCEIWLQV
jgi:hypothetical protein